MSQKNKISFIVQAAGFVVGAIGAYGAFKNPWIFWPLVAGGLLWFAGWFVRHKIG